MSDILVITGSAGDVSAEGFDAQVTDPPYGEHVHAKAISNNPVGCGANPNNCTGVRTRDLGFAAITQDDIDLLARNAHTVRRWSVVFSDYDTSFYHKAALAPAGAEWIRTVPWIRWGQPQLSGDRIGTMVEYVTIAHRGRQTRTGRTHPVQKTWNGRGDVGHFETWPDELVKLDAKCLRGKEKFPCEKPLDLMLSLVSWFSDPGDAVLDPYAGSGTTGQACRLLDRDCCLVEIDPAVAARAEQRVRSPLTKGELVRVKRWIDDQNNRPIATTDAARERYERAQQDIERVKRSL